MKLLAGHTQGAVSEGESGMSAHTSVMLEIRVSLDIEPIRLTRSPVSLVWGSRDLEVEPKPVLLFFF